MGGAHFMWSSTRQPFLHKTTLQGLATSEVPSSIANHITHLFSFLSPKQKKKGYSKRNSLRYQIATGTDRVSATMDIDALPFSKSLQRKKQRQDEVYLLQYKFANAAFSDETKKGYLSPTFSSAY